MTRADRRAAKRRTKAVSGASAGRGKKVTTGQIIGRCANSVAATPGAQIFLLPSKETY